jgi:hypothetical protein
MLNITLWQRWVIKPNYPHCAAHLEQSRHKPTTLNRKRTLTFLVAMLFGFKASVQIELNAFLLEEALKKCVSRIVLRWTKREVCPGLWHSRISMPKSSRTIFMHS